MADDKGIQSVIVLGGLAALGYYAYTKFKEPEEGLEAASLSFHLYDSQGNPVTPIGSIGHIGALGAAFSLVEGETYSMYLDVTNNTKKGTTPWPAQFTIKWQIDLSGLGKLTNGQYIEDFNASQTKTLGPASFTLPWDSGGRTGTITAVVNDPNTVPIASDTVDFSIGSSVPTYGAGVSVAFPSGITEGATYDFAFSVANTSNKDGNPVEASFNVTYVINVAGTIIKSMDLGVTDFGPLQSRNFGAFSFTTPWTADGSDKPATLDITIKDTAGGIVTIKTVNFTVFGVPITYGAVIDITDVNLS